LSSKTWMGKGQQRILSTIQSGVRVLSLLFAGPHLWSTYCLPACCRIVGGDQTENTRTLSLFFRGRVLLEKDPPSPPPIIRCCFDKQTHDTALLHSHSSVFSFDFFFFFLQCPLVSITGALLPPVCMCLFPSSPSTIATCVSRQGSCTHKEGRATFSVT
jgi:hypothetical protein